MSGGAVTPQKYEYWNTFAVAEWYPLIEQFTFPTQFIPVSMEEAQMLLDQQLRAIDEGSPGDLSQIFPGAPATLQHLLASVDSACAALGGHVAVKLSDRSPKDAAFSAQRVERQLAMMMGSGGGGGGGSGTDDGSISRESTQETLVNVYRAMMRCLQCRDGSEVLRLILDSFRILEDVQLRLRMCKNSGGDSISAIPWNLNIVVRQWCPELDPVVEYRAFSHGRKLCAVSQYIYDCFIPEIVDNQLAHALAIQHCWDQVCDVIASKYEATVIDFALIASSDGGDYKAMIVELNPSDASTDGCLFNWTLHRSILEGRTETPTFEGTTFAWRVVESRAKVKQRKAQQKWWRKIIATAKQL